MEKADALRSEPGSPARQAFFRQPLSWLARRWDLLALLLLLLASFPAQWLFPQTLFLTGTGINLIDDSWHLDTAFKSTRGVWFGRDVVFTYGPLYQWLASAPVRWKSLSMGAVYATCNLLPLWCAFLSGYLALVLLLPEQPAWKRFVLLLLLCGFWMPWEGRTPFAVFFFALFLRGWYALRQQKLRPEWLGCGAALLGAVAFLYSADTGAYALAALVFSLAGVAWEARRQPHAAQSYLLPLLAFTITSLVLVVAINGFMAKPFDFRFWKNSLAILAGYRWIEPAAMSRNGGMHLLAALIGCAIVFLVRGFAGNNRNFNVTARSGFLLSAFAFVLFTMQAGLVRSYWSHIVVASYVAIFLTGVVLSSFASHAGSALAVLVVVGASLLFGEPPLLLSSVRNNYGQLADRVTECPPGFLEFDRVCYPGEFTHILQTTSGYLQQQSQARDSIVIFPYQTMFGIASRRNVAGGLMQSYLVSGPYLSQMDIAGLEQAAAPAGLFLRDIDPTRLIDGVSNFTRSPEVWLWTFRHYRRQEELAPGIFGLQRDDSRARGIAMQLEPLDIAAHSYTIPTRNATLDLGDVDWPVVGADAVRLRLIVRYRFWWKLRKPARLVLEIERADSSHDEKPFIIEPNVSSEVWFYPWDDEELAQYFNADENNWRPGQRQAITHLRLVVMPMDWVSLQPYGIEVQSVDAVRFSMGR